MCLLFHHPNHISIGFIITVASGKWYIFSRYSTPLHQSNFCMQPCAKAQSNQISIRPLFFLAWLLQCFPCHSSSPQMSSVGDYFKLISFFKLHKYILSKLKKFLLVTTNHKFSFTYQLESRRWNQQYCKHHHSILTPEQIQYHPSWEHSQAKVLSCLSYCRPVLCINVFKSKCKPGLGVHTTLAKLQCWL